jgi:hypothetical protein
MSRSITIKNIPDVVYDDLQQWAKQHGVSVSAVVRRHVLEWAPEEEQLGFREWVEWLDTQEPLDLDISSRDIVEALHAGRAERY